MEVFKGSCKNRKGLNTYDLYSSGKHLMFSMSDMGYLTVSLFYDDCDKDFWFEEDFLIDKSNQQIYRLIDGMFFSYGDKVYFDTQGADLTLEKDEDGKGYVFNFVRNFKEDNKMIESKIVSCTMENKSLVDTFIRLQDYDPSRHQIHMTELESAPKKLNKSKKNIES